MSILPLVDLLILMGTGSLMIGFVIKVIALSTRYVPSLLGFTSIDFVVIAAVCFGFALTLVGRSWLKFHEPQLMLARRDVARAEARLRVAEMGLSPNEENGHGDGDRGFAETASADRR